LYPSLFIITYSRHKGSAYEMEDGSAKRHKVEELNLSRSQRSLKVEKDAAGTDKKNSSDEVEEAAAGASSKKEDAKSDASA
jgi:hypothetical protein